MILWVVGQYRGYVEGYGPIWDLQGVFDEQEKAVAACIGNDNFFVGPVELNKSLPIKAQEWPGSFYPHKEK